MGIIGNTLHRWKEAAYEAVRNAASDVWHQPLVGKKMAIAEEGGKAAVAFYVAVPEPREAKAFNRTYAIWLVTGGGNVPWWSPRIDLNNRSLYAQQVSFGLNSGYIKTELKHMSRGLSGPFEVPSGDAKHEFVNHAIRTIMQLTNPQSATRRTQFAPA